MGECLADKVQQEWQLPKLGTLEAPARVHLRGIKLSICIHRGDHGDQLFKELANLNKVKGIPAIIPKGFHESIHGFADLDMAELVPTGDLLYHKVNKELKGLGV